MTLLVTKDVVLDFLRDENLSNPIKIKDKGGRWCININDPFIEDTKLRLGISPIKLKNGKTIVAFNGWKSVAHYGDDYKGSFFKFVKLIKNFNTSYDAKKWFVNKYILPNANLVRSILTSDKSSDDCEDDDTEEVYWPPHFEKMDFNKKSHSQYINFLLENNIPEYRIKQLKLFIDKADKRIVFPCYRDGELIFYAKRSIEQSFLRWMHSHVKHKYPIWNLENVTGDTIYIFEGILDAIYVENGVALMGVGFSENIYNQLLERNYKKYVVVMDNDEPGRKAKINIADILLDNNKNTSIYNYYGIHPNYKDFREMARHKIPFELDKRVIKYDNKCKVYLRMNRVI